MIASSLGRVFCELRFAGRDVPNLYRSLLNNVEIQIIR